MSTSLEGDWGNVRTSDNSVFPQATSTPPVANRGRFVKPDRAEKDDVPRFEPKLVVEMPSSIYCSPIAANGVLYITTKDRLSAIETKK